MAIECPAWSDADLSLLESVYQLQFISRMNAIYYELRLSRVRSTAFWMETIIAVAASGSGVAALVATGTSILESWGSTVWPAVALMAAVLAVIRPIYSPGESR